MAEISCLQVHDPNDDVSRHHHVHRRRRHSHRRRGESLTRILDSIPCWVHPDDFDLYLSDTSVFAGDVFVSDSVVAASDGLDLLDRRSFVMDPFHQAVERSQVTAPHDDIDYDEVAELRSESGFGLIEGNCAVGMDSLELDSESGLESGGGFVVENIGDSDIDDSVDLNRYDCDDHDDVDFYIERRPVRLESSDVASTRNDIRVIESGSDDDDENGLENEDERDIWGLGLNVEDVYVNDDDGDDEDDASVTIPLCWDSLQLEDHGVTNEDFGWEEVDGAVDERDVVSVFAEADNNDDNSVSISVSPIITYEDLEGSVERIEDLENLGREHWEVLLNYYNLEPIPDGLEVNVDQFLGGDHDDYIHTTEYEMLFEQFADADVSAVARPPASQAFVRNLPSVVLAKGDVGNDHALCAVCMDEMNLGDEAAQLPCSHKYHRECILPWLGIRNTCPVCRHELPTDDTEYERRKSQRSANGL